MTAIYQEHFGLTRPPFQITPDTDYFFTGNQRGDVLGALSRIAGHEEGIVTVVAEVGSGKTLLARRLLDGLPAGITPVCLTNPCFNRQEILSAIGRELGLAELPEALDERLAALHQELLRRHANGERVLLVIDEAHAMPAESLEEVRLLSNLETSSHKLVNIMLFGQPELDTLLADPRLRQVRDRVIHRFELAPFSREDAGAYLDHRLRVSGWKGGTLFADAAVGLLSKAAAGRARRLNLLADKSLSAACHDNVKRVEKHHARVAINALPDAVASATSSSSPAARRHWPALTLPRLSLAGSLLALTLAGTAVWGHAWQALSPQPGATVAPPDTTAAAAKPAVQPTMASVTTVPPAGVAAPARKVAVAETKRVAPPHRSAPVAKARTAEPLKVAAATGPGLKLAGELASVQRIVPFAVSTAALGPNGRKALAEIVPLARHAERVNVRGRTDSSGNASRNRQLARARATSVLFAFVAEGVPRQQMKATYCTHCFVASNDTLDGRRTNRRVDIEVVMPAKLALHLPKPVWSAPDADEGPPLLARLDEHFTAATRRN